MARTTPLIGLITSDALPPPAQDSQWQLLANVAIDAGVDVVFFHPDQLNARTRQVRGLSYRSERGWLTRSTPLPRVLIDSVTVHYARTSRRFSEQKKTLRRAGFQILNPRFPDKWGVWQALLTSPDLVANLPQTTLLQAPGDVEAWLQRHPAVFLKPVRGSGGVGVVEIRTVDKQTYQLTSAKKSRILSGGQLRLFIEGQLRQGPHLLQSGIPLLDLDGRKLDLRVYLQRDGRGDWQAITTVPRLAAAGQVVTNLAQGGVVRSFEWLEEATSSHSIQLPSRAEIEAVAITAARALTVKRKTLAFLGIDIALDHDGHAYLLDINPRPGRKALTPADKTLAFRYLLDFAASLL
ncbi:YheC/YheD family protein [Tumebacillus permanentifrigoris]|uniref:Glutathione synthase/RimK-type ligase-like ATP-grasp enzyme n=1 Tax=Tumebacillus permanentifrigoris TaxID=378543 RepID=A0A316D921_9BACL|nr:YheC/YheD family protein [Tumebacillus permanentifrigoris]PWK07851.1 glutathione synthase/RimK-type ligase-like ATP-grasp enzyme [Tumebacillus permanentifrigoris]